MRRDSCRSVPMTKSPPDFGHAVAELNVGAAAGHVRRNRHGARLARARDDLRFLHVILRVENVCGIFSRFSMRLSNSRRFDAHRADEDRLALARGAP